MHHKVVVANGTITVLGLFGTLIQAINFDQIASATKNNTCFGSLVLHAVKTPDGYKQDRKKWCCKFLAAKQVYIHFKKAADLEAVIAMIDVARVAVEAVPPA